MRIQFLKHPDTLHWRHEPMIRLGQDDYGMWFGATTDTWFQKGDVPVPKNAHERGFFCTSPLVQLVVPGAWWTMIYNGEERDITHYVDIVTPAKITDEEVLFTDLDLDVIRRQDGTVLLDDEDEFLEHSAALAYPEAWIDKARTTAAEVHLRLDSLDEPFDAACRMWRGRVLSG